MLIVDGRPVELDAHLARLSASARELYGDAAEARTRGPARALAESEARDLALGRLRLTLAPDGAGRLDLVAKATAIDPAIVFPAPAVPDLAPVTIPGGLGAHKWADRRPIDVAARAEGSTAGSPHTAPERPAATAQAAVALILDADGTVLEAERANVFATIDGALVTPPPDGRILPGVTRARVMKIAGDLGIDVRERPLTLDDLDAADEAFLTGSVRGIEPVRPPAGPAIAERLAAELRRRWLG